MRRHRAAVQRVGHCKGLCQPRVHVARLCSRSHRTPRQHGGAALDRGGLRFGHACARVGLRLADKCLVHQCAELGLVERTGLGHAGLQRETRRVAVWVAQGCSLHCMAARTSAARPTSFATAGSSASMPSILRAWGSSEAASRAVPFSSAAKTLAVALPSLGRGWAGPVLVGASNLRRMRLQHGVAGSSAQGCSL